jgi:hypothetical protein
MLPQIFGHHLRQAQVAVFRHFARTVAAAENITPGLLQAAGDAPPLVVSSPGGLAGGPEA